MNKPSVIGLAIAFLFLLCGLIFTIDGIKAMKGGTMVETKKYGRVGGRQAFLFGIGSLTGGVLLLITSFRKRNGDDKN
jgi:hypothetical protein